MSANRSKRQVRAAILGAPVAEYHAWELLISCRPCDRLHESLAAGALGTRTVADGVRRLRCRQCGGRPTTIVITNGLQAWRQMTVVLEGDGAYG